MGYKNTPPFIWAETKDLETFAMRVSAFIECIFLGVRVLCVLFVRNTMQTFSVQRYKK